MALLVVMVLMGVMMTAGFAIASRVDTQTSASQAQRVRDSAFNLAESALNAQIFAMSTGFKSSESDFDACPQPVPTVRCPDNASLVTTGSPDLAGATWQTTVHDNGPDEDDKNFYSEATRAQPGWDVNGDGNVWVRAQGTAQGRSRTLIALVRSDKQDEVVPKAALIAGRLDLSNSGNSKLLVNGDGMVAVRCDVESQPNETCVGHPLNSNKFKKVPEQIAGVPYADAYVPKPPAPANAPAIDEAARMRLKATAIATGSYYLTCPTEAQLKGPPGVQQAGRVVYVENANCTGSFKGDYNVAPQLPGMLLFNQGAIEFGGNARFNGVVYAVNATTPPSSGALVTVSGTAQITGGVLIDGPGTMVLGASKENLVYDVNAFSSVASFGSAGIVQNTFRELRAG